MYVCVCVCCLLHKMQKTGKKTRCLFSCYHGFGLMRKNPLNRLEINPKNTAYTVLVYQYIPLLIHNNYTDSCTCV